MLSPIAIEAQEGKCNVNLEQPLHHCVSYEVISYLNLNLMLYERGEIPVYHHCTAVVVESYT